MSRLPTRPADPSLGPIARIGIALDRLDLRRLASFVAIGLVATATVAGIMRSRTLVAELGAQEPVAVAKTALESGHRIVDDDLVWKRWPVGLIPPGTLDLDPVGSVIRSAVGPGEPVTPSRLGIDGGPLTADELAVTIPLPLAPPPVSPGDLVDLIGLRPVFAGGELEVLDTVRLGRGRVITIDETGITVAVADDRAVPIVETVATGTVEMVLTPFGS